MFIFKEPIIRYDENYLNMLETYNKVLYESFDDYYENDIPKHKDIYDYNIRKYLDYTLDSQSELNAELFLKNKKYYNKLNDELLQYIQDNLTIIENNNDTEYKILDIICPYTNKIVRTVSTSKYFINFKVKKLNFVYKYDDNNVKIKDLIVKKDVHLLGKVDKFTPKFETLTDMYHPSMFELFENEWGFSKENILSFKTIRDLDIVSDSINDVTVYYSSNNSFELKKVYFSKKLGRYFKYKGKRIVVPSKDIENLDTKITRLLEGSLELIYAENKKTENDLKIEEIILIMNKVISNDEKIKKIRNLFWGGNLFETII